MKKNKSVKKIIRVVLFLAICLFVMGAVAFADGADATPTSSTGGDAQVESTMNKVIDWILSITRWVGVVLGIWGIYETVMSFMQQQPEAKTKGIIMIIAGVVMISLKSVLKQLGFI